MSYPNRQNQPNLPPTNQQGMPPQAAQPKNVKLTLILPEPLYQQFSQMAQMLHKEPLVDPRTNQVQVNPQTGQPVTNLPSPDVQTFLIVCGINTIKGMELVKQMMNQQQQGQGAPQQ